MAGEHEKPAILVDRVSKSFDRRVVRGGYTTFKTQLVQLFRRGTYVEKIQKQRLEVLRDLSFEIRRGETVGIIGDNGAGKSTLLKLFTGIYRPTTGRVEHHGRISALLELGAGFHPEFSGRENIYMNGMILGLSRREVQAKEASIIAFSELEEFIDAPVRTYSSGMYMRLAFAIAVHVEPEILIIDEILAVGDEHFQRKSYAKINEFKTRHTAIVLVTHSLNIVEEWCTRALWIDRGRIAADGDPREVVARYRAATRAKEAAQETRMSELAIERGISHGATEQVVCRVSVAPKDGETLQLSARLESPGGIVLCQADSGMIERAREIFCTFGCPRNAVVDAPRVIVQAKDNQGRVLEEKETRLPMAFLRDADLGAWQVTWSSDGRSHAGDPSAVAS